MSRFDARRRATVQHRSGLVYIATRCGSVYLTIAQAQTLRNMIRIAIPVFPDQNATNTECAIVLPSEARATRILHVAAIADAQYRTRRLIVRVLDSEDDTRVVQGDLPVEYADTFIAQLEIEIEAAIKYASHVGLSEIDSVLDLIWEQERGRD